MTKPKVITLCGSSRFVDIMAVTAWVLERDEGAIAMSLHLLPAWYPGRPPDHLAEHEGVAEQMDELHLRKIDRSDGIFVVDHGGYTGDSTKREVAYADGCLVPVRWFSSDPVGVVVRGLMARRTSPSVYRGTITATHRIITDQCRERPIDDVFMETMASVEEGLRGALKGWPAGEGTEIHARVDIERAS